MLQREPKAGFKNSSFQSSIFFLLLKSLDIGSSQRVDEESRLALVERVSLNTVLLLGGGGGVSMSGENVAPFYHLPSKTTDEHIVLLERF